MLRESSKQQKFSSFVLLFLLDKTLPRSIILKSDITLHKVISLFKKIKTLKTVSTIVACLF